jgi:TetR/AcrR family transcriptional regulator, transcriptional repressor for nem operon
MADIMQATGLSKSSLYNSFGSKRDLFGLALANYQEFMFARIEDHLTNGEAGLDDLHWLVSFQREISTTEMGRNGCLAVNASAELGAQDEAMANEALAYRTTHRAMFEAVLQRAAAQGEVDAAKIPQYVELMLASSMTGALLARSGAGNVEMNSYLDAIDALIESFRS